MMPKRSPRASAVSTPHSLMPNTGRRVASRHTCRPGSLKHAITKASAALSCSTSRRSGSATCSTSFWLSMPNGPSESVTQRIEGPSARRSVPRAASSPVVTAGFEFGLMTRISARAMACPLLCRRPARPGDPATTNRAYRIARSSRTMTCIWSAQSENASVSAGDHSMSTKPYDLVLRGGTVATASAVFPADVAIDGETVAVVGRDLPPGVKEIDARGKLVLPGGVDSHAHIEQVSAAGILNADTFESATVSAAFGGTTTVIPFAAQHVGMKLPQVLEEYHALARRGAVIDYAFHMIIADPTRETLERDLPDLIKKGHASIKIFMTYDLLKIDDEPLLDILLAARDNGALLCAHAENHGIISWMVKRLLARGYTAPKYHAISHVRVSEAEAFNRLIGMAALIDQPIMIFHVSTAEGAKVIRDARGEGLKVFAETCPQYLFLTAEHLDKPGAEGAKWMCSPPPRTVADQEALWRALSLGDLQTISSDHAPYRFDENGKLRAGPNPDFKQVANGLPGLEVRLPLLFDAMVSKGRLGLEKFVELTATAPAKIYNLHPRKGSIAIGADADIAIWDPEREVTLSDEMMHDRAGYTPYAGRTLRGWPVTVLSRGRVIVADGKRSVEAGSGRFLARSGGEAAKPTGRLVSDMDPERNFGAKLL